MNKFSLKTTCALLCSIHLMVGSLSAAESPGDKLNEWIESYPSIGLVAKKLSFGPITLSDLNLDNNGRIVIAEPGEEINATVKYKVKTDKLDSWSLHHIIVGIDDQDNATCITHSLGVWDKKGESSFVLKAPEEKGVYQVCFDYQQALLCSDGLAAWQNSSDKATVGVIIVK